MARVETIGNATLYLGDCREILPTLGKVDAVVTSPPYDQQRQYGLTQFDWRQTVCGALGRISSPNAQILVNLGLVHRNGAVNPYWNALISEMEMNGWRLFGWYVWDQLSGMTGDWHGRLAPSFEFIFHFNRIQRVVNKTKPTSTIGRQHSGGLRKANGTVEPKTGNGEAVQPTKIPDSVIRVFREMSRADECAQHPARFPVTFASELILPFSDRGEIILDPFMGSGTTGVAAIKLGRQFVGVEKEPKYFDVACRRIDEATRQPDMFIKSDPIASTIPELLL